MAEKVKQYRLPDDPITLDELKSFLWAAATHLRGQIDAAGYKEYIFPLLFFKRISDVYDEQFEGFVCEGGVEYAGMQVEDLPIRIPDGAHWRDVREVTENVGNKLVEAFIAIEQANPAKEMDGRKIGGLEGIFGPKDGWTNKAKMPDNIITSLIEDFSKYTLSLKACPADEMGQAYEYLVGKFADDAGNTAQEFYTNRTVVQLMAEILGNQFVNYANDIAGGTKMPRMPLTELRNFDCILPPMDKQLEFVFIAEQVDKSKFELKQCIENIDKVIKSLING